MASIPADLTAFLAEKRDSREYRRALAVKLALQGYLYQAISQGLRIMNQPKPVRISCLV